MTEIGVIPSPARPGPGGVGDVLALFRQPRSLTRADVGRESGLSRGTVNQRLEVLLASGLIVPTDGEASRRGRPAERFEFNSGRGVLLLADLGATALRTALSDLTGTIMQERFLPTDVTQGPEPVLELVLEMFNGMLRDAGIDAAKVEGIGYGVPGPVDFKAGLLISPPIMTGWDHYDLRGWFARHFTCPVVVDKDVNTMAFGEHRRTHPDVADMLYLKLGTGVGSGIIANGQIYRGADGAAGDIGHQQLIVAGDGPEPLCRCGNTGCVEAYAGGWAILRDLQAEGVQADSVDDVVTLIQSGHATAVRLARDAGRTLGIALSGAVSLLNPSVVVIGGQLAAAESHLFAGMREMIYRRSLPLATRHLQIVTGQLGRRAGVIGLGYLVADWIFAPDAVELALAG